MTDIPGIDGAEPETTGPDGSTAEVPDTSKEKNQVPRSSLKSSPGTNAHHDEPEQPRAYQEPGEGHLPQGVAYPPGDMATASLTLYLPPGTAFKACPTGFCGYYSAGPDRYWTKRLTFNPAPPSEGLGHTGEAVAEIFVKAHSFGYIANDVDAAAAIPQLYYYGPGSPLLATEYIHVPSPNDYDWSAFAPESVGSTSVVWAEPSASGTVQGRVNVGINHAGQSRDSNKTFIAGALVGLAGAALLSAIVEAFHLLG